MLNPGAVFFWRRRIIHNACWARFKRRITGDYDGEGSPVAIYNRVYSGPIDMNYAIVRTDSLEFKTVVPGRAGLPMLVVYSKMEERG